MKGDRVPQDPPAGQWEAQQKGHGREEERAEGEYGREQQSMLEAQEN